MFSFILHLLPLLCLHLSATVATENPPPYDPTDTIFLDCGELSNTTVKIDGRSWDGDEHSKFFSDSETNSFVSTAPYQDQSVTTVPYMKARIIRSNFTYTFPVSAGPIFLRLYFYPVSYSGLDITASFFSVSANSYTLLNNFSAYHTVSAIDSPDAAMIKEFVITISEEQILNLNFNPSPSSFAFINGIEVVSMPENLYVKQTDTPITSVNNRNSFFYYDKPVALETAYRLNVGGPQVSGADDTGMFREWRNDLNYISPQARGTTPFLPNATIKYTTKTPAYVAPTIVYTTSRTMYPDSFVNMNFNLTWLFSVDPGFSYLVRLHFCETLMEVTRENQRVFSIFINNQTAEEEADVIHLAGGSDIPVYQDFVVWVPIQNASKQEFRLELHPMLDLDPLPTYANAILNGLEIFKLNNSNGNLAGQNPAWKPRPKPQQQQSSSPERTKNIRRLLIVIIIAAVLGVASLISLLCFIVSRRRRKVAKESASGTTKQTKSSWGPISYTVTSINTNASSLPSDLCRRFSIVEIREATSDFDDQYIIGSGGFGNVYKGYVDDGSTTVAIKRLNSSSNQGIREFHTEIEMISKVRHLHIVSLIGYCVDLGEMILVYEYMSRGNVRDHLYNTDNPPLPWKQRLEICIGAARGLHYLHTGAKHVIIHRDVKTTNILLDEKWVAKVSDFGLSRFGPTTTSKTHVSTVVKGSIGYLDPEYYRLQHLTEKSDVYSFGVVLFEVLCARAPILRAVEKNQVSLAAWARQCYRSETVYEIIDPVLKGQIAPECLKKFAEVAMSCLEDNGARRPSMSDVVWGLEFALQLQETAEKQEKFRRGEEDSTKGEVADEWDIESRSLFSSIGEHVLESKSVSTVTLTTSDEQSFITGGREVSGGFFSEIMNPQGR